MQSIFQEFGKFDQFSLSEESHKYPEWRKFVDHLEAGYTSRFEMNYEDFFSAFAEGENHLFKADEDYLEQSKAMFLENGYIYRLV